MTSKQQALATECKRYSESCLYTSTALYIWLRTLGRVRLFFVVTPLVLGSLASWKLLTASDLSAVRLLTSSCAFFAGLLPSIFSALKFDDNLTQTRFLAGEFKNLQDRFRNSALVSSRKPFSEFEADVEHLLARFEAARSFSITPPEWCFRQAQRKIKSGDYDFDVDITSDSEQGN